MTLPELEEEEKEEVLEAERGVVDADAATWAMEVKLVWLGEVGVREGNERLVDAARTNAEDKVSADCRILGSINNEGDEFEGVEAIDDDEEEAELEELM
jgi:hypothetical protein